MTVIVNSKVHIKDNYKEPTDGKFDNCIRDILKNFIAAEDSSDNKSNVAEDNWWTKSNKKLQNMKLRHVRITQED